MHQWLEQMRGGDREAREQLLNTICGRLERLARKMLGRFPNVCRWTETGDVLQGALLRLLRTLEKIEPITTRAFFGLAAEHVRRELLDLARHFYGPEGIGANQVGGPQSGHDRPQALGRPEGIGPAEELERWCAFHRGVEELPVEEREVVALVFYHGWTQAEVAELFGVSERTIRRRWQTALLRLSGLQEECDP